jgi:hypothetical protein
MTLLQLTPDGERLRRIAKAHAAGELSTPDYRRIRSDVIERFATLDGDITGDDTQQRWPGPASVTTTDDTAIVAAPRTVRRPTPRVVWLVAGGLLVIVLLATGML